MGRLIVLMVTAFVDMMGGLIVFPLVPFYAKRFLGHGPIWTVVRSELRPHLAGNRVHDLPAAVLCSSETGKRGIHCGRSSQTSATCQSTASCVPVNGKSPPNALVTTMRWSR